MSEATYRTEPLSSEMERRIQDQLKVYEAFAYDLRKPFTERTQARACIATLNWVLAEAEAVKQGLPK